MFDHFDHPCGERDFPCICVAFLVSPLVCCLASYYHALLRSIWFDLFCILPIGSWRQQAVRSFLCIIFFRLSELSSLGLSSGIRGSIPLIILMYLYWTFSSNVMSLFNWAAPNWLWLILQMWSHMYQMERKKSRSLTRLLQFCLKLPRRLVVSWQQWRAAGSWSACPPAPPKSFLQSCSLASRCPVLYCCNCIIPSYVQDWLFLGFMLTYFSCPLGSACLNSSLTLQHVNGSPNLVLSCWGCIPPLHPGHRWRCCWP